MAGRKKCASSRPPNAQSCPWLMFSHGKSNNIQTFYSIADNRCLKRMLPHLSENNIRANCDGWVVITGDSDDGTSLSCFMLHLISTEKILLPNLENLKYRACLLSSSPLKPKCVVAFISSINNGEDRKRRIKLWRPNQENWVEVVNDYMLSNFITCDGKIYGIHKHDLLTVDMHDNNLQIERQVELPTPTFKASTTISKFLIESCGEIFVIIKFLLGAVGNRTIALQVYKLLKDENTTKMDWVRVTDIGDRTFFIDHYLNYFSCSATQAGLKGNSVYFTGCGQDTHMYRYNLLENRSYKTLPCSDVAHNIRQTCWLMIHQPAGP